MASCHPDRPHNAHGLCAKCARRKWYIENRASQLQRRKEWWAAHGNDPLENAKRRAYYLANREKKIAAARRYRAENPEKTKHWAAISQARNKDKIAARHKEYYQKNRAKIYARQQCWNRAHPELVKNRNLRYHYGITLAQLSDMKSRQDGRCAICQRKKRLAIDHNHKTGKVVALLCGSCNRAIGLLQESETFALAAAKYLKAKHL